jgi:hypothetical protein
MNQMDKPKWRQANVSINEKNKSKWKQVKHDESGMGQ